MKIRSDFITNSSSSSFVVSVSNEQIEEIKILLKCHYYDGQVLLIKNHIINSSQDYVNLVYEMCGNPKDDKIDEFLKTLDFDDNQIKAVETLLSGPDEEMDINILFDISCYRLVKQEMDENKHILFVPYCSWDSKLFEYIKDKTKVLTSEGH